MEMQNNYNLDFIISRYDVILLDSCAIMNPFKVYKSLKDPGKYRPVGALTKSRRVNVQIEYLEMLIGFINEGKQFYLTNGVLDELKRGNKYNVRKGYARVSSRRRKSIPLKTIERCMSLEDRLVSAVQNNGHIVRLSEGENLVYKRFSDRYDYLKEASGMNENDADLLISGLVISQEKSCALLSNDTGILKSYNIVRGDLHLSFWKLGFFMTMGTFGFKDPDYYFDKKRSLGW